jgi:ATP-dependent Clp protease ATP-binding subunit ClpB
VTPDGEIKPAARDMVMAALRRHFPPEFLNRIDDIVLFKPLTLPEVEQIVDLMTDGLRQRLADRSITLELTGDARRLIADRGFDPVFGARPLRRFIARDVETRIGRALISGAAGEGAEIEVDAADGEIAVHYKNAA